MGDQGESLFNHAIYIDIGKLGGPGAREIQKIVDDFAGTESLLDDLVDDAVARIVTGHLLGQHLYVIGDDGERSIDFVGHAGSEQTERGELLGLRHLLFQTLALRHVVKKKQPADALTRFADQGGDGSVQGQKLSLMMQTLLVYPGNLLLIASGCD